MLVAMHYMQIPAELTNMLVGRKWQWHEYNIVTINILGQAS